jgi:uncharacterized membrane protein YagU involved in acid resistance
MLKTILLAGTLDIAAACLRAYATNGTPPDRVLQYIAAGVFGKSAYAGGYGMMAWGLLFHFIIAAACVICFFWAYPRWSFLRESVWINSVLIGVVAWVVTTQVVVPLSRLKPPPFRAGDALIAMGILVVCIGLPTAFAAKNYFRAL